MNHFPSFTPRLNGPSALRAVRTTGLLLATACASLIAAAQPAGGQSGQGGPRTPPAEALAACKSLASGAACSFTSPHGKLAGTCFAPEGKPLACRPAGAPPQGGNKPSAQKP